MFFFLITPFLLLSLTHFFWMNAIKNMFSKPFWILIYQKNPKPKQTKKTYLCSLSDSYIFLQIGPFITS